MISAHWVLRIKRLHYQNFQICTKWQSPPKLGWPQLTTPPSARSTAKPRAPRSPMSCAVRTTAVTLVRLQCLKLRTRASFHNHPMSPLLESRSKAMNLEGLYINSADFRTKSPMSPLVDLPDNRSGQLRD